MEKGWRMRTILMNKDGDVVDIWEKKITFRKDGSSKNLADLISTPISIASPGDRIELDFRYGDGKWNSQDK